MFSEQEKLRIAQMLHAGNPDTADAEMYCEFMRKAEAVSLKGSCREGVLLQQVLHGEAVPVKVEGRGFEFRPVSQLPVSVQMQLKG